MTKHQIIFKTQQQQQANDNGLREAQHFPLNKCNMYIQHKSALQSETFIHITFTETKNRKTKHFVD